MDGRMDGWIALQEQMKEEETQMKLGEALWSQTG